MAAPSRFFFVSPNIPLDFAVADALRRAPLPEIGELILMTVFRYTGANKTCA
jgi:hypothetical protein